MEPAESSQIKRDNGNVRELASEPKRVGAGVSGSENAGYENAVVLARSGSETPEAESAPPDSEAIYRALFENMGEAFCLVERVNDAADGRLDFRYIAANPAFATESGAGDVIGKTMRQVFPNEPESWFELCDRVLQTGEPARFEGDLATFPRILDFHVFRIGDESANRLAILFRNVTGYRQTEEELRRAARLDAFRVKLNDALQTITDPVEIQQAAMRLLGEYFQLSRAYYFAVERDEDGWIHIIDDAYQREPGGPSMIGRHSLKHFGDWMFEGFARGEVVAAADVTALTTITAGELASYRALGVTAFINVPLLRNGEYSGGIGAHDTAPHTWTPDEIALIREVAARMWTSIERARAEEDLRESEERFRALIEQSAEAITVSERDGTIRFASPSIKIVSGYTSAEFMGRSPFQDGDIHPDDAAECRAVFQKLLASPGKTIHLQHRYRHKSGEWRWLEGSFTGLFHVPAVSGLVANFRDITERKQAEADLGASEARFRAAFEQANVGIVQTTTAGHILVPNPGFCKIIGYSEEEAKTLTVGDITHPDDYEADMKQAQRVSSGEITGYTVEKRYIRKDGKTVWVQLTSTLVRRASGEPYYALAIVEDISARKQEEAQRLALERETVLMAERNRMAQELHDTLAQGFTGIKMQMDAAEYALEEAGQSGNEVHAHLVRAREIARSSLAESRSSIRALRSPLLQAGSLVAALERLAIQANDGVKVGFTMQGTLPELPATVENDLYRIGQEALTNALRHAQPRRITMTLACETDAICLEVQDDGRGFDTGAGRAGFGVTGIQERGLRLKADLHIISAPGQGTTVSVRVPLTGV